MCRKFYMMLNLLLIPLLTGIAFGNGGAITIYTSPSSSTASSPPLSLNGKYFGFASIKNRDVILDLGGYFGSFDMKFWLSSSQKDLVNGKYISLFSKYGFICNVKVDNLSELKGGYGGSGARYISESSLSDRCLEEIKRLPKYYDVLFMYPALEQTSQPSMDTRVVKEEEQLILSSVHDAISQYALKSNLKRINLRFLKTKSDIVRIGAKGTINQYFVETKVGTKLTLEGDRTHLADTFSFIIEVDNGSVTIRRIDFLPKGGDSSGYILLKAIADIDSDGLTDLFLIRAGCCSKVFIFDGIKWIKIGYTMPA